MIQNEDYIEFDIKSLFFYVLRQWKPILIISLSFALLIGGYMAYSEYRTSLTVDMENSYWREYQQYQDQIAFFDDRVSATQNKINNLQEYIEHSILIKADYRNIYIAKAIYYVDSNYKILPENTFQDTDKTYTLAWYYLNYLSDYSVFEEIGNEIGIEAKYLMELVEVSLPNDCTVAISVSHPQKQLAENIMAIVQRKLKTVHQHLCQAVNDHTITMMMDTCGIYIDEELKESQQDTYDELLELQDDLIAYKDDLYELEEGSAPGELNMMRSFMKWIIIGALLGGAVVISFLLVKSIINNRLHSSRQLISSFQATVLGEVIYEDGPMSRVDHKINALEGCLTANSEKNYQFLAENVMNHCGDAKNVIVCCDVDSGINKTLATELNRYCSGIRLLPVGDLQKEAGALHMLYECDAVILVAVRDNSRNSIIKKLVNLIRSYKKEIVGFIVAN